MGPGNELVELLWKNGQVVFHSQTHRKPSLSPNDSRQFQKHDQPALLRGESSENSSNLIQNEDSLSWIQYPLEDPFEKELYSNFLSQSPPSDTKEVDKPTKESMLVKFGAPDPTNVLTDLHQPSANHSVVPELARNSMPPPGFLFTESAQQTHDLEGHVKFVNFSQYSSPPRECSVMTIGSSHSDSNQIANDHDPTHTSSHGVATSGLSNGDFQNMILPSDKEKKETVEAAATSPSGGSVVNFGRSKQATGVNGQKRKERTGDESECQSEATKLESAPASKPSQRSVPSPRGRASEVHNLSERRRRDRINEKMRALQELIPHCNKTDKASMLEEAIEYLKSLQLQLQMMWMGSGMAPMMFPGVHCFSGMDFGIGPPVVPSFHNQLHLQRVPLVDQSMSVAQSMEHPVMYQTPVLNPVTYQDQTHSPAFYEQRARYLCFQHLRNASQHSDVFGFGSEATKPSQTIAPPVTSSGYLNGGAATNDAAPTLRH